jgi:hypothetical protein
MSRLGCDFDQPDSSRSVRPWRSSDRRKLINFCPSFSHLNETLFLSDMIFVSLCFHTFGKFLCLANLAPYADFYLHSHLLRPQSNIHYHFDLLLPCLIIHCNSPAEIPSVTEEISLGKINYSPVLLKMSKNRCQSFDREFLTASVFCGQQNAIIIHQAGSDIKVLKINQSLIVYGISNSDGHLRRFRGDWKCAKYKTRHYFCSLHSPIIQLASQNLKNWSEIVEQIETGALFSAVLPPIIFFRAWRTVPTEITQGVVSRIRTALIQSVDMERSDKWPFGTNLVVVEKVPWKRINLREKVGLECPKEGKTERIDWLWWIKSKKWRSVEGSDWSGVIRSVVKGDSFWVKKEGVLDFGREAVASNWDFPRDGLDWRHWWVHQKDQYNLIKTEVPGEKKWMKAREEFEGEKYLRRIWWSVFSALNCANSDRSGEMDSIVIGQPSKSHQPIDQKLTYLVWISCDIRYFLDLQ